MTIETVERAQAEVRRLVDQERAFSLERREALAQLQTLAPGTGEPTPEAQAKVLAKAKRQQERVEALEAAETAVRTAREAAITECHVAEAQHLQAEATQLRDQAAERGALTDELLAKLADHEGVAYVPAPYGGPTITAALLADAEAKESRAAKLTSAGFVPKSGGVRGDGVDSLAEAVWADPFRIGPTWHEIEAWYSEASAAALEEWQGARRSNHLPADAESFAASGWRVVAGMTWRSGEPPTGTVTLLAPPNGRPPSTMDSETKDGA